MKKLLIGLAVISMAAGQIAHAALSTRGDGLPNEGAVSGSLISAATPIPSSLIIAGAGGLEWTWALPVHPTLWGGGSNPQLPSYRAAEGWFIAGPAEWALHPSLAAFANPAGGYFHSSPYWSDFSHVDPSDFAAGHVGNGAGISDPNPYGHASTLETLYVRRAVGNPAPDAGSALGLLGLALLSLLGLKKLNSRSIAA